MPIATFELEVAANSLASALAAQTGGADRVELCGSLSEGGITPSYGTLAMAREQLRLPLYVLVRPRAGDFFYTAAEFEIMRRDIEICVRLGCDGVVIGALDADAAVDTVNCAELVRAAGTLGVTFHRAFDLARDRTRALEDVIALGCERVLTSGGSASAPLGADAIGALVNQAAERISVMVGAGITAVNLPRLIARTGVRQFHASARSLRPSRMRWQGEPLPALSTAAVEATDETIVRALAGILRQHEAQSRA